MKQISFFTLIISIVLTSCYPKGANSYSETDIVYTNYNSEFDFASQ